MTAVPASSEDLGATLVIRTWSDPATPTTLRARLLTATPAGPVTWSTAVGDAAIAQEVLRWLHGPGPDPAPARPALEGPGPRYPPLVDAPWLRAHLDDPDPVVLEADDAADRRSAGHLPGATGLDWVDDLHHPTQRSLRSSSAAPARRGRTPAPPTTGTAASASSTAAGPAGWRWATRSSKPSPRAARPAATRSGRCAGRSR